MLLGVVARGIALEHDGLGGALLPDEQHGLVLLGRRVDEEGGAHVVHVGHQDGGVLGHLARRVAVLLHVRGPVLPRPLPVHHALKHGLRGGHRGQVQAALLGGEGLHLGPVVQLQQGTLAPHQRKDVETLQVLGALVGGVARVVVPLPQHQPRRQVHGLGGGDGLGVHPHLAVRRATLAHGTHQHRDALGLAGTGGPQGHEAVAHALGLVELDELEGPWRVVDEAGLPHLRIDGRLQRGVAGLVKGDAGEEVVDEAHEEGHQTL